MNKRINILLLNQDKKYSSSIAVELIKYNIDINQVFYFTNIKNFLTKLDSTNIHIVILYLNMKCNEEIIQYIKENDYANRLHIIGVYKEKKELNKSYISDYDILIQEGPDFKVFCFQLFQSYKHNEKKYRTIELICDSEKKQEKITQMYDKQQFILKKIQNTNNNKLYTKIMKELYVLPEKDVYINILKDAILSTIGQDDFKYEPLILALSEKYSMTSKQVRKILRYGIYTIFNAEENREILNSLFKDEKFYSKEYPSTKDFLTVMGIYYDKHLHINKS